MNRFLVTLLGSFFYTGFFPVAPATFASLVWLALWLFVPGGGILGHWAALAALLPAALWLSHRMERIYGTDASQIVIDEIVGMQVTLLALRPHWMTGLAGFFLFRLFDILKPFPAGRSQRLPGGWGVVTDDVIAGIYAFAALFVLRRLTALP
ncbi:MAG: phosphatidylglycerophosphatase A [Candidatus Krumholzibacteria bacterium]|nr:phosphatidylglycerophosphatase A [Candidatus Krumholzibacteria bacterium]